MWVYFQGTGQLKDSTGRWVGTGYSGNGKGKNNGELQHIISVGPIPRGFYKIGEPYDSESHGPYCLPLTPFPETEMWGRAGMLMHGDSKKAPGTASQGCIIQGPAVRKAVWNSGDHLLEVKA